MPLNTTRERIAEIDAEIARLAAERAKLIGEVRRYSYRGELDAANTYVDALGRRDGGELAAVVLRLGRAASPLRGGSR